MILSIEKTYCLKKQPDVLVKLTDTKVEITGPLGTVCVPAVLLSCNEEILLPVAMLADVPEKEIVT